jgi:uncharacterized protein YgiM (DUF1202 family)
LQGQVQTLAGKLSEAVQTVQRKNALVESKEREVRIIKESTDRKDKLAEMLKPLNNEKAAVMRDLLESVQTERLQSAYEKYLPAVMNNYSAKTTVAPKAAVLTESRAVVTGDKSAKTAVESKTTESYDNVVEIKRLAGLK